MRLSHSGSCKSTNKTLTCHSCVDVTGVILKEKRHKRPQEIIDRNRRRAGTRETPSSRRKRVRFMLYHSQNEDRLLTRVVELRQSFPFHAVGRKERERRRGFRQEESDRCEPSRENGCGNEEA
jgi:hypothetical protein